MYLKDKSIRKVFGLILIFVSSATLGCAQDFNYKNIPNNKVVTSNQGDIDLKGFYAIDKLLPNGFVRDGSVDYTVFLQKAIDTYDHVLMPDFPVTINATGLSLRSNTQIYFGKNSKIILSANNSPRNEILRVHNVSNVTIFNPSIVGDRVGHNGTDGQWGMGISIRGSSNIKVINPQIKNCWGDGIYIGALDANCSNNIQVLGGYLDFNRRNGLSITCGSGIQIKDLMIANTSGQNPKSGIDIEPNNINNDLKNIVIENLFTFNNEHYGVLISLHKFDQEVQKNIGISVLNHKDDSSRYGFAILEPLESKANITGKISLVNPTYMNNLMSPFKYNKHSFGFVFSLVNPAFYVNKNNKQILLVKPFVDKLRTQSNIELN